MEVLYQQLLTHQSPKGNLPLALCRDLYERKLLMQDDIEQGITKKIPENDTLTQAGQLGWAFSLYLIEH